MIKPVAYKKTLEGKSNAHLITFNDGRDYVVKYFQPGFEKSLANEWVAYCLARYLGLPIPFAQLVEIPQEFSSQYPELSRMTQTQFQFASLYMPDCLDGHQVTNVPAISNKENLAGIILFDYWMCNRDRTRKNIILCDDTPNSYRLWIIDHAEVFSSYNWSLQDIESLPITILKSATHQIMACFIENEQVFYEQLEIIQTIPIHLIEEIVAVIPEDWQVTSEERKAIVSTLHTRRKRILKKLMERFIKRVYLPIHVKDE
ncbi:HipA family kinase [Neobacillus niacini]|uniref:HipA family kinase n=1 Tax=Neobacillus niacini TaxID=86668 RepID=UPI002FFF163D